jgi:hypothetical protein
MEGEEWVAKKVIHLGPEWKDKTGEELQAAYENETIAAFRMLQKLEHLCQRFFEELPLEMISRVTSEYTFCLHYSVNRI